MLTGPDPRARSAAAPASPPAIGIGAGGHARSVIDAIWSRGPASILGLLDSREELVGQSVLGLPILGGDEQLERLRASGVRHAFIGIGTARSTLARTRAWDRLHELSYEILDVIHATAIVSSHAVIGTGVTILARSVVGAGARIGRNVVINTGAIVEHDCQIDDHVHLATGAILAGGVTVGDGAFVGAGSCVLPQVRIGPRSVIGAGAVVTRDIPPDSVVFGNPARPAGEQRSWTIPAAS